MSCDHSKLKTQFFISFIYLVIFSFVEYTTVSAESQESIRSHCVLYQDRIETLKGMLAHLKPACFRQVSRFVLEYFIGESVLKTV